MLLYVHRSEMAYWGWDSPKDHSRASFILVGYRVARHTSLDESSDGYSGKTQSFNLSTGGGGGGGGGRGARRQSSSPSSRPSKLNNPTSADHSLPPIWSKILPRNRARSAQSSTKLCILIGLLPNTGLIIFRRLHSL